MERDLDFWSRGERDAVIGIKYNDLCSTVRTKRHKQMGVGAGAKP